MCTGHTIVCPDQALCEWVYCRGLLLCSGLASAVTAPVELRDALVMQNFKLMALMMAAPEAVAAAKAANCIPTVLAG